MKTVQLYLAEGFGTFALVFVGAGSLLSAMTGSGVGMLGVALAHGLILMMVVYTFGNISGAHVNPAVTFGLWVAGKMKTNEAVGYILSQLIGGVVAGLVLMALLKSPDAAALGTPMLSKDVAVWKGLLLEAVFTFFLVWSVMSTSDKKFPAAASGLTVGLTLTVGILVIGSLTGGALNPARAFGPAAVSGYWINHLVYWAGPLLGALAAAVVNRIFRK